MLLTRREFEVLSNTLPYFTVPTPAYESVASLFKSNVTDALNDISEARRNIDSAPKSMRSKITRALDLLEDMVKDYYDSLAEKRGPLFEAVRLYVLSAIDPSIKWYKPILDRPDEALQLIPLMIPYRGAGAKNIAMALKPTPTELEVFLTSINPVTSSLAHVLDENAYEIRDVLEEIVRAVARASTIIGRDEVVFMRDETIKVTVDEAARIANKLRNFDVLYVLRYPFYDTLAKNLSEALRERVWLELSTETSDICLVIPLDNLLSRPEREFSGVLRIYVESSGVYPERIERIELSPRSVNRVPASGYTNLLKNVEIQPSDDYARALSNAILDAVKTAEKVVDVVVNHMNDLLSAGATVSSIEVAWVHSRGSVLSLKVKKAQPQWDEASTIYIGSNGKLISIETSLKTRYSSVRRVVDVYEWKEMVSDVVRDRLFVDFMYAHDEYVSVGVKPVVDTLAPAGAWFLLSNTLVATFDAYKSRERELREKHRVDTRSAVALLLAYYSDPSVKQTFESRTTRSFSEVFLRVGAYLSKLGKPIPGAYSASDNPEVAVLRLLEVGAFNISEDGRIYVAGSRLNELLSWLSAGDVEHKVLDKMLSDPKVATVLMLQHTKLVGGVLKAKPELSAGLVKTLAQHGDKIPKEHRSSILAQLSPKAALELLLSKSEWIINDSEALATVLYLAGKARESSKLTSFVLSNCPQVVGSVQTISIGSTEFIEKGNFLVLFAGLVEPSMSSRRIYEVYDRRTKRGMLVSAVDIDEAVDVASRELQRAMSEYRLLVSELERYESEHGVQIDITSKNTEGYIIPEIAVRRFEADRERLIIIPLQPRLLHVFTEKLKSLSKQEQTREEAEEKAVT